MFLVSLTCTQLAEHWARSCYGCTRLQAWREQRERAALLNLSHFCAQTCCSIGNCSDVYSRNLGGRAAGTFTPWSKFKLWRWQQHAVRLTRLSMNSFVRIVVVSVFARCYAWQKDAARIDQRTTQHRWLSPWSEWGALLSRHDSDEHRGRQRCRCWSCHDAAAAFNAGVILYKTTLLRHAYRAW
jgi:hypothetical protein